AFFFSSRRRHTRCLSDWSSDVCSSDLVRFARNATYHRLTKKVILARNTYFGNISRYAGLEQIPLAERFFSGGSSSHRAFPDLQRSEERRVGKECRDGRAVV